MYAKSGETFLTVIRLRDNAVDNILCAKYDPSCIGKGEVGTDNDSVSENASMSALSSTTSTERKRKSSVIESAIGLQDVMKLITKLCGNNMATPVVSNVEQKKNKGIEHMPLQELYDMLDQYKRQLKFLK